MGKRAHAQFMLPEAQIAARKKRRVEWRLQQGQASIAHLDFSHISSS